MDKNKIIFINCGEFDTKLLEEIAEEVMHEFNYQVTIINNAFNLTSFYNIERRQYEANYLLKEIEGLNYPNAIKKIGLFRVDLYIPILTYIFGQARFKGDAGLVSIYRLKNEPYGIENDEVLAQNRFKKVIIHELGHTFGLVHCLVPNCVMRPSTYVEDIDQKSNQLCVNCKSILKKEY
ncbi:MAG TPA: archaemetzincin family Zn-dependent metalloprotease [Bacteroidales bacterium]